MILLGKKKNKKKNNMDIKQPPIQKPRIVPADKEETAKLLMTWAKRHGKLHTFKIATYLMMEIRVKDGLQPSINDVIHNFYQSTQTEIEFVRTMEIWKRFIQENGNTWRQVQMHRHPNAYVNN